MYDIDAIEAINFEQLATVTDRLLLRGRVTRRRLSTNKIHIRHESAPKLDHTQLVKRPRRFPTHAAVLTSLSAIVISLVTLL
jgi:hypothetical protein